MARCVYIYDNAHMAKKRRVTISHVTMHAPARPAAHTCAPGVSRTTVSSSVLTVALISSLMPQYGDGPRPAAAADAGRGPVRARAARGPRVRDGALGHASYAVACERERERSDSETTTFPTRPSNDKNQAGRHHPKIIAKNAKWVFLRESTGFCLTAECPSCSSS